MSKKIGDFLFVMLVLCAALAMLASGIRQKLKPEPAAPAPTHQTGPVQTNPQTPTADSIPTGTTEPDSAAYKRVKKLLQDRKLDETSRSVWVWNPDLNPQTDTEGTARESLAWALAQIAAERKMNPIAAFWVLVTEKLYTKTEDTFGYLTADAFTLPAQAAKTYAYTEAGSRELITDLLTLAAEAEDGLELETEILGSDGKQIQVSMAPEEGCWYGYFICGGERSTHILCFYLRPDKAGAQITDVEFQLLNLRSARGSTDGLAILDRRGDNQVAALMAAAELLLTGDTQAGQGKIPFTRSCGDFTATVERFRFTAEGEAGSLTNYRLRK